MEEDGEGEGGALKGSQGRGHNSDKVPLSDSTWAEELAGKGRIGREKEESLEFSPGIWLACTSSPSLLLSWPFLPHFQLLPNLLSLFLLPRPTENPSADTSARKVR